MKPSRDLDKVMVRMPDGMRAAIQQRARSERRSANAEIVLMLERALKGADGEFNHLAGNAATAATGAKFGDKTPAAALNETALAGGPINPR